MTVYCVVDVSSLEGETSIVSIWQTKARALEAVEALNKVYESMGLTFQFVVEPWEVRP
jgi:hypothetical protein